MFTKGFFFIIYLFLATTWSAQSQKLNILYLLADDMRFDCISALGNPRIHTPNLDRLVARGMTFTRATCSSPICTVSRAELLDGRHGWEIDMNDPMIGKENTTWPEAFKIHGYETWHIGKWHVKGRPSTRGYTRSVGIFSGGGEAYYNKDLLDWKGTPITGYPGWVFQSDDGKTLYLEEGIGLTPGIDAKFADSAIALIKGNTGKPWFCHVNFTAPHDPLIMPPGLEGKYKAADMKVPVSFLPEHPFEYGYSHGRDEMLLKWPRTKPEIQDVLRMYYSVIEYLDRQIGRIINVLEETGQLDNTIIIFSSDNGLACGAHGIRGKQNQYEHSINVPLIISGPGIERGSQTDAQVYLRELYPTTCELAGIHIPGSVSAKSFLNVLLGNTNTFHEAIFGYFTNCQRMVRTEDGWKLIYYPNIDYWQLFYLKNDPYETTNLFESIDSNSFYKSKYLQLSYMLNDWRKRQGDPLLLN